MGNWLPLTLLLALVLATVRGHGPLAAARGGAALTNTTIGPGGYPRGVQLASGTQLMCAGMTIYSSAAGDGRHWNRIGTVLEDARPGVDLGNCNLALLPGGRVLASYRHHVPAAGPVAGSSSRHSRSGGGGGQPRGKAPMSYAIQVSASDDGGASWAALGNSSFGNEVAHGAVGLWEPFLWPAGGANTSKSSRGGDGDGLGSDGNGSAALYCAYSAELTNGGLQSIVWKRSDDGGRSWGRPVTISDGTEHNSRDGMPAIARLQDESLLLVFEGFWQWFAHNTTKHHFSVQVRTMLVLLLLLLLLLLIRLLLLLPAAPAAPC